MKTITTPTTLLLLVIGTATLSACIPASIAGVSTETINSGAIERTPPTQVATNTSNTAAVEPKPAEPAKPADAKPEPAPAPTDAKPPADAPVAEKRPAPTLTGIAETALGVTESNVAGKPEAAANARQALREQLNARVRQLADTAPQPVPVGDASTPPKHVPPPPLGEHNRPSLADIAIQAGQWADSLSSTDKAEKTKQAAAVRKMLEQRVQQPQ